MENTNSKHVEEFFEIWEQIKPTADSKVDSDFDTTLLDNYAKVNNQFINIYSLKQHKVVYMSNNFSEVLGYACTKEDYEKWAAYYWLRDLPLSQSMFFLKFSYFYQTQIKKQLDTSKATINFYMHNFKLKVKGKETKHLGLNCRTLDLDSENNLDKILIINNNVRPLCKSSEVWWMDLKFNDLAFSFHHQDSKIKAKALFSDREKAILKLIATGQKNKDIAEELDISQATVEKHRNNVLENTGAKDISSLLEILRLGNIL